MTSVNKSQICTIQQARDLAQLINSDPNPIGGGVPREDPTDDYTNDRTGIFLDAWRSAFDPRPANGFNQEYRLRFNSGYGGNMVGLIYDQAWRSPRGMVYALKQLRLEADAWRKANPEA